MTKAGHVIFLNRTSSAGKTSIARAILATTERPYIHLGVDQFILAIPERHWASGDDARRAATFATVVSGYHHSIAALVQTGNSVIADHVLQEPGWWSECAQLLAPFPAYLITVFCPLAELERRETGRGDRELGIARFQFNQVYGQDIYDFKVDTSQHTPEQCARRIEAYLESGITPFAFQRLVAAETA